MTGDGRAAAWVLVGGAVAAAGCWGDSTTCSCVPPGIEVSVPPDSAPALTSLVPSGNACGRASVACEAKGAGGACSKFHVTPNAPGDCHIDAYFSDGTHDADDVNIVQTGGCCAGLYPEPPSAGEVDFPGPGSDAGQVLDAATG